MKNPHILRLLVVGSILASMFVDANADLVTNQSSFSVGYGFGANTGISAWNTNETASANTPPTAPNPSGGSFTVSDFRFTITVNNSFNSTVGPVFYNRVLGNAIGSTNRTAQSQFTTVSVKGEYVGTNPPTNAASYLSFRLQLDQLSVYAHKHPDQFGGTTNEIWWIETTPGHTSISPSIFTPVGTSFSLASDYAQLNWNPPDFLVIPGTNSTRTFAFPTDRNFMIDGLEIIGSGQLIYDVPEPATGLLVGVGVVLTLTLRRQRNR